MFIVDYDTIILYYHVEVHNEKSVILVILLFSLIFFLLFIFMNNIVNDPLSEKEIIIYGIWS